MGETKNMTRWSEYDPAYAAPKDYEIAIDCPGWSKKLIADNRGNHICGSCFGVGVRLSGDWAGFVIPHHEIDRLHALSMRLRTEFIETTDGYIARNGDPVCKAMANVGLPTSENEAEIKAVYGLE